MLNVYLGHSWVKHDRYKSLVAYLEENISVSFEGVMFEEGSDELLKNEDKIRGILSEKIKKSDLVIILAGSYSTEKHWTNNEILLAKQYGKKIIAVELYGPQRTSILLKQAADYFIGAELETMSSVLDEQ